MQAHSPSALDAALMMAKRHWRVFPVKGKVPLKGSHGFKDATCDEAAIRAMWKAHPDAGVAVATGAVSGIIVVDVDPRNGGDESLERLITEHGQMPPTLVSLTSGGGYHAFYDYPQGIEIPDSVAPGIDLKADGGYVVVPPSVHPTGQRYQWHGGSLDWPEDWPLPLPPEWVGNRVRNGHREDGGNIVELPDASIPRGERNKTLTSYGGAMRKMGMDEEAIARALLEINKRACKPPLDEEEVLGRARSVSRYPKGSGPDEEAGDRPQAKKAPRHQAQEAFLKLPEQCLRGTFGDYVALWREYEGTDAYDLAAALTAYGLVLGRTVSMRYGRITLYPNFYAVCYGPSNAAKKSSAGRAAVDIAMRVDPTICRLGAMFSAEGLLQQIGHPDTPKAEPRPRQKAMLELEEFALLLRKARQEGTAAIIPLLTHLWDCPPSVRHAVKTAPVVAVEPTVSLLGGSTTDWLQQGLTDEDTMGGFTNRNLFVTGPPRPLQPFPPAPDGVALNRVVQRMHDVMANAAAKHDVPLTLAADAEAAWTDFYYDFHNRAWGHHIAATAVQRIPVYILKTAMLYAIDGGEVEITAQELRAAIAFGEYAATCTVSLFREISGTAGTRLENLVVKHLRKEGCLTRVKLHEKVGGRFTARELDSTVEALKRMGRVGEAAPGLLCLTGVTGE